MKARDKAYSLLVLAGGKSSRMGRDKAELIYEGKTFMETLLDKGEQLGIRKKYLSGHEISKKGVYMVYDVYENRGPLGGLHACMEEMDTPYCLVLPVDVPQIPLEILEGLLCFHEKLREKGEGEFPLLLSHEEREEPLLGIYPVSMKGEIEEAIRYQPASVFSVLNRRGYQVFSVETEAWQTENINTPETYGAILNHKAGD